MKSSTQYILLYLLLFFIAISCNTTPHGPAAVIKTRQIISKYKAVFTAPPKHIPSFNAVDGPITGNGDIGITVSGPPESQRYWISKNDFWKSGPGFKQCGPSLIGGIDLNIDELKEASYHIEQILYEPVIASEFSTKEKIVNINARVLATDNLIFLEITAKKNPVKVQLNLWAKDGYGSITDKGQTGDLFWVTRTFNETNLLYPTEAAVALRSSGQVGNSFIVEPGKPVTITASVITNHEHADYFEKAKEKIRKMNQTEINRLIADHDSWWQSFWAKSFVEIEDKLLEKYYYASNSIMACCSRNINFPPGLYGNWTTMDRLEWAGDIHLNYNHEAPFWAVYSSNHVELSDPYDAPLLDQLEKFKLDAKKYLNIKGAYASVGLGPKGLTVTFPDVACMDTIYGKKSGASSQDDLAGEPMFLGQKSNAIFAAMNMILRYHYTYDQEYISKVYPYLVSVADFWENYLKFEKNRYVIYDDSYWEVGPWEGEKWKEGYGDINPISSLGFIRFFFKAMTGISRELNVDSDRLVKWNHILSNISDLPVYEGNGIKRYRACGGGTGSAADKIGLDFVMMHSLVFPATNFGLSSSPEDLKVILDDMKNWDNKMWMNHGNAFQTVFIGAARVGFNPDSLMYKARKKIEKSSYPNLWIYAGGGGIETCSGIPGMINEMMLQSHEDVIRVFPVFPDHGKASFYHLRTFGAFIVSSAIENGNVRFLIIESEKGRKCIVRNPWVGKKITLYRNGGETETISGDLLSFSTKSGEIISVVPDGGQNQNMEEFLKE
jgi:hypothetical protein